MKYSKVVIVDVFASNPRVRKHLACIHVGKVQSHTFLIIFFDLFHPSTICKIFSKILIMHANIDHEPATQTSS